MRSYPALQTGDFPPFAKGFLASDLFMFAYYDNNKIVFASYWKWGRHLFDATDSSSEEATEWNDASDDLILEANPPFYEQDDTETKAIQSDSGFTPLPVFDESPVDA